MPQHSTLSAEQLEGFWESGDKGLSFSGTERRSGDSNDPRGSVRMQELHSVPEGAALLHFVPKPEDCRALTQWIADLGTRGSPTSDLVDRRAPNLVHF